MWVNIPYMDGMGLYPLYFEDSRCLPVSLINLEPDLSAACWEDHPRTDGYVANNHGDSSLLSPQDRQHGTPSKWPNSMAYEWGLVTNHLRPS